MPTASPAEPRTARIFGVLFALTFVTSIAAVIVYDPSSTTRSTSLATAPTRASNWAPLCEILLAITNTRGDVPADPTDAAH